VKFITLPLPYSAIEGVIKKPKLYFLLMLTCLLFSVVSQAGTLSENSVKAQLDTFVAEHRGEVIYVDFWASWCGPCRKSFPWMNKIKTEHKGKGFTVISINLDAEHDLAQAFLKETPANFAVLYDPKGELARFFKIQGMPSSLIINKKGEVKYAHSGFFAKKIPEYEQEIQQLLAL